MVFPRLAPFCREISRVFSVDDRLACHVRRVAILGLAVGLVGLVGALALQPNASELRLALQQNTGSPEAPASGHRGVRDERAPRPLRAPSGSAATVDCQGARRIIKQARAHLAASPQPVDPKTLPRLSSTGSTRTGFGPSPLIRRSRRACAVMPARSFVSSRPNRMARPARSPTRQAESSALG